MEFGGEVVFLCVEVFDLGFELDDLAVNAGDDVGFRYLDVISAWGDFSFGGLRVDGGEFERAVVVVADVADGYGRKVVECVNGNNYSGEGVVFVAVGFDKDLHSVADTELSDLLGRAEVDFKFDSVDFNDAGVGCGFHFGLCLLLCLILCEEVFVWLWGDDSWPTNKIMFFEEVRCVARGDFDFFKLGLSDGNEARFAVVHCGSSVVGLLRDREALRW